MLCASRRLFLRQPDRTLLIVLRSRATTTTSSAKKTPPKGFFTAAAVNPLGTVRHAVGNNINLLCNVGNGFAVIALVQQDMLVLRSCMVCASACGITFNLLQPKPLYTPAGWGLFFVCGHLIMIALILRERQEVTMNEEQLDAYEECFQRHGFTPRHFKKLMEIGQWHNVAAGIFS